MFCKSFFGKALAAALILTTAAMAAETVIASWDFSKADVLTSGSMPFLLRHGKGEKEGGAKIENGFLICSRSKGQDMPTGIQSIKAHPSFSPQGAFKFIAEFKLEENLNRQNVVATIFDNKYISNPNAKQKAFHKGFQILLRVHPGNRFAPRAAFGFGDKSKEITGTTTVLEYGKLHKLEVFFTGKGQVIFKLNDKESKPIAVPEGSIAPSSLRTVIGDRYGSSFAAFGGAIAKVTLIKVDDTEAAPAAQQ